MSKAHLRMLLPENEQSQRGHVFSPNQGFGIKESSLRGLLTCELRDSIVATECPGVPPMVRRIPQSCPHHVRTQTDSPAPPAVLRRGVANIMQGILEGVVCQGKANSQGLSISWNMCYVLDL